jgi:ketosteroid isomerase-like protein
MYDLEKLRSFLEDLRGTFDSFQIEADEFIDAGEQVVVPTTSHGRGRGGIEVTARTASVYTLRDGAVTRLVMYQERREALEAVGLRG